MLHSARLIAFIWAATSVLTANACMQAQDSTHWISLLDESASAWRGYLESGLPAGGQLDGRDSLTSAGSSFALHAPIRDVTKKAGAWNEVRLVVKGDYVEHWLNGVKLRAYELGSGDWSRRVAKSKFKDMPPTAGTERPHRAAGSRRPGRVSQYQDTAH